MESKLEKKEPNCKLWHNQPENNFLSNNKTQYFSYASLIGYILRTKRTSSLLNICSNTGIALNQSCPQSHNKYVIMLKSFGTTIFSIRERRYKYIILKKEKPGILNFNWNVSTNSSFTFLYMKNIYFLSLYPEKASRETGNDNQLSQ